MAGEPSSSSVAELILSLEQAILAAKHLPSAAADPSRLLQVHASLHRAHAHLSAVLHSLSAPPAPSPADSESLSSSDEPMQLVDDAAEAEAENSGGGGGGMVEAVEEKMRDCFIRNTRRKRPLSPAAAALAEEERRRGLGGGEEAAASGQGLDPYATRLRALELVYQFHG